MKSFGKLVIPLFIVFVISAFFYSSASAALSDGSLVRADGTENIYLIENGIKRWVESSQAFQAQGFRWEDVHIVSASEIENIPSGQNVGIFSKVILPGEESYLPDLAPFAVSNFLVTELNGRTILRFESTFWNMGARALQVRNGTPIDTADPDTNNVYQRILKDAGQYREKLVNDFIWHPSHNHYHYENFINYVLKPLDTQAINPVIKDKESFCFWDSIPVNLGLPGAPSGKIYSNCDATIRQGISVGWADVYERTLAEQYIDINNLPTGTYSFATQINIGDSLLEKNYSNNKSVVILHINASAKTVQLIASGAPFQRDGSFNFPDGMLIKGDSSEEIYITHNNKKRQLRGSEVLASYGYSASSAIVLPQDVVDAMPYNNLIRADGTKVYALNDDGYKRHISNPAIFESYGLSWQDIADIKMEEFLGYSDARFVRIGGSTKLYYQYDRAVWPLSSSATTESTFPWSQLQIINSVDFNNYILGPTLDSIPTEPPALPISSQAVNNTHIPLSISDGYRISYFTHMYVGPVRFMAISPDGILFVSRPSTLGLYSGNTQGGAVLALPDTDNNGEADRAIEIISGLTDYPHGLAFYNNYLYVAEQKTISRYPYLGNAQVGARESLRGLPSGSGHISRTIAFSPEGKMYISIGSSCNVCEETDERRAAILESNPSGEVGRIFASGLRNAVGMIFKPGTNQLWVTENGRDHLGDNLPPDEINIVQDGAHYGWPYCYGNKITDPQFNNSAFCSGTQASTYNIQAHSAPLGLRFIDSLQFSQWEGDLFVAYQGSWNRTVPTGNKIVRLDVEGNSVIDEEDFISGWLQGSTVYGRPIDVIFGPDGAMYISDETAQTIYRVDKI